MDEDEVLFRLMSFLPTDFKQAAVTSQLRS